MRLPHDTQPTVQQLTPADVRGLLADTQGWGGVLLDVREPWEYDIAHIPGSRLIPLALLPRHLPELVRIAQPSSSAITVWNLSRHAAVAATRPVETGS